MHEKTAPLPFDELLALAAEEVRRRRIAALPPEEELRGQYDFADLDRRIAALLQKQSRPAASPAEETPPKKRGRLRRPSRRAFRRVLLAAVLLAALAAGTAAASAEVRAYVKEIIVQWTERNVGVAFETDGALLTELPAGYGPHYIPEGFVYKESESLSDQTRFSFVYRNENDSGEKLIIDGWISENSSMVWTDNEHISFSWVEVNGAPAYLGTFIERDGYTLIWAKDGIEHSIYFETDLPVETLYQIAEQIY
ncbi:MAG TPA: DUF4367 domain-containing protein [Firmicutes bacterium]|nr:DUF4367 domain-containing protein [Bacillota bacterium]